MQQSEETNTTIVNVESEAEKAGGGNAADQTSDPFDCFEEETD